MEPSKGIIDVWDRFDSIPVETLTKAWYWSKKERDQQRSVVKMQANRQTYGCGGNSFDLSIWLVDEFTRAGYTAWAVGHHLFQENTAVAVIVEDDTGQYFCNIGRRWNKPAYIGKARGQESIKNNRAIAHGYEVSLWRDGDQLTITSINHIDLVEEEVFSLKKLDMVSLREAAEFSQRQLVQPYVAVRTQWRGEFARWEFRDFTSCLMTEKECVEEMPATSLDEWVERIHQRTGMDRYVVRMALAVYRGL